MSLLSAKVVFGVASYVVRDLLHHGDMGSSFVRQASNLLVGLFCLFIPCENALYCIVSWVDV